MRPSSCQMSAPSQRNTLLLAVRSSEWWHLPSRASSGAKLQPQTRVWIIGPFFADQAPLSKRVLLWQMRIWISWLLLHFLLENKLATANTSFSDTTGPHLRWLVVILYSQHNMQTCQTTLHLLCIFTPNAWLLCDDDVFAGAAASVWDQQEQILKYLYFYHI